MNAPLALGVIGCGRVTERYYVPAFARLLEIRVAAVADRSEARSRLIAARFPGCRAFDSAEALFDGTAVQGVVIATPPETHLDIARLALRRGLAVFVEKPLARSDGAEDELPSLETLPDRLVMLGFNRRYWDAVRRLREALRAHRKAPEISARLAISGNPRTWGAVSDGSDALDDQGSHHLDLIRYLFDREVIAVSAQWTDPQSISMRVKLAGGVVAECVAAHNDRPGESIAVDCGGRLYRIRRGSERVQPSGGRWRAALDAMDTWRRRLQGRRSSLRRSYEEQLRQFARGIRSGAALEPGFADGLAVLRIAQAARRSAARGGAEVSL
jgi:predicted dehydrogenase